MAVSVLKLGYNATWEIDTGSNDGTFSTHPELGGWTTGNLTVRRTNPDSTNVDTGGYEGKEYGIKGVSFNFECLDDQSGDAVQDQLLADFNAGTKRWFRIRPRVGSGYVEWLIKAVINNAAWTVEQNGIVRFNLAADSDGSYTKQDQ